MTHIPNTLEPAADWRDQAECARGYDPEWWYPVGTNPRARAAEARATAICARCPVIDACAQWAADNRQEFGIWGGLTEDNRRAGQKRSARGGPRPLSPCGTVAAYKRHHRRGETPCGACREANRLVQQAKGTKPTGRPLAPCGTNSAYNRHTRKGEPVDEACRRAHREADRRLRTTGSSKAAA